MLFLPFDSGPEAPHMLIGHKPLNVPKLVGLKESMPGIPGRVRFADMDADGYPDAMLTLEYSSEDGT